MMVPSENETSKIVVSVRPPVARLALQNPPLNILDLDLMHEFAEALVQVESNSAISVLVLSGSERAFSAGVDIAAHAPDQVDHMLDSFHSLLRALVSSKRVVIAVVQGQCLGGGAELAMVSDIVITADYATWGFPEVTIGCFPPAAAAGLWGIVGQKRAAELILTGRQFNGAQAHAMGLASFVVAGHQVEDKVTEVTSQLSQLSSATLSLTKKALSAWDSMHFEKALSRAEKVYREDLIKTSDAQEGVRAFLEKRKPVWKGR